MDAESRLRFIEARRIETPAGHLAGAQVVNRTNETLGTLNGVLVDPGARRVAFYVVESAARSRHVLVPQAPARLDASHEALEVCLDSDDLDQFDEVEPARLPRFSDDDLLTALFQAHTP